MSRLLSFLIFCLGLNLFFPQRLFPVDQYGLMTDSADIRNLKEKYKLIGMFQKISENSEEKRARVLKETDQRYFWGVIDQTGNEVIPAKYISVSLFENGSVKVKENISFTEKYNCGNIRPCIVEKNYPYYYFVDKNGVQISDYYEKVHSASDENYLLVNRNGKNSVVSKKDFKTVYQSQYGGEVNILPTEHADEQYRIIETSKDLTKSDFVDRKGNLLTGLRYRHVFKSNNFVFANLKWDYSGHGNRWYLLDGSLQIRKDSLYTEDAYINRDEKRSFIIKQKEKYFLIGKNCKILSDTFNNMQRQNNVIAVYDAQNRIGLMNKKGKLIIPLSDFHAAYQQGTLSVFARGEDESMIFEVYNSENGRIRHFNGFFSTYFEKYIKAGKKNAYGITDFNFKTVIPPDYIEIIPVNRTGYFWATNQDKKTGLINDKNEVIVPFVYDNIAFDLNIINPRMEDWGDISKYLFIVVNGNNHMGVINFKNQFLVPFEGHYWISDRTIWKGSKMGYITLNHKVIPAEYDDRVEINYGEGLFFLVKDGKVGLVNENNEVLIPFIFEKPDRIFDEFYAGRYTVFNYGNRMQMIEKGGKLFYPEAPDGLYDAPVKMKEGIGIINGNTLLDIYKNKIETVYLDDNFEKDDFQ